MSSLQYDPLPFEFSGLNMFVPDPEQVRQAYVNGSTRDFPYWSRIWPSAIALSVYINENRHLINEKKICEVGAGLGLPSFMAAKYASSVLITDHDQHAIEWINYNISKLDLGHVRSGYLNWHQQPYPKADIVLMSDVGYQEDDLADVHRMIRNYIDSNTPVLLTTPARIISGKFLAPLEDLVIDRLIKIVSGTEVLCVRLELNT